MAAGGKYAEEIDRLLRIAEGYLVQAKLDEYKLGTNSHVSITVRDSYIKAVCAYNIADEYQRNKIVSLSLGLAKNMGGWAINIAMAIIGATVVYLFKEHIDEIVKIVSNYAIKFI